jgi:hypothetical protein
VRPLNFTVRTRVDALLAPVLLFLGFFAGTLFGAQMLRWGALLWVSTTTHGGDFLGPPKPALLVEPAVGTEAGDDLRVAENNCNSAAGDWFKKAWPHGKASTPSSQSTATYTSHYNAKRGKCFMLVTVDATSDSWQGTLHSVTEQLIDLHANRAYATFEETRGAHPICLIEGRVCKAKVQWEMLVRALYLEDKAAIAEALRQRE